MTAEQKSRQETVFRKALELSATESVDSLAYRVTPTWDSVAHMQLIAALETEFDIMLDTKDVIGMSSYQVASEILARYVS